jgi:hypothetical protein
MARTSLAADTHSPNQIVRDAAHYDALWGKLYKRARRDGMSDGMARYFARSETMAQKHADQGTRPYGSGDLELMY